MNETGNEQVKRAVSVPAGITYFIRAGDSIKIGFASNLKRRLGGLQSSHHEPLEVLAAVSAADVDEYLTHQRFAHLRIRGEWFRSEPDLLSYIDQINAAFGECADPEPEPPARTARKPLPDPVIRGILKHRNKVGPQTPEGRILSNIVKLSQWLNDPDPRPWATHPTQTVQWMMNRQLELLAKYSAA
jgi:hypothetical protein